MDTFKLLAWSHLMLGSVNRFEEVMLEAAETWPQDSEPHYQLGRYYFETKAYQKALQAFHKAVQAQEDHYKAHYYAALCLRGNGQYAASEKAFKTAIRIVEAQQVRYGWPFADLGELLILLGRDEDGLGWMYRGIRHDPDLAYTHFKYASALFQRELGPEIERELLRAIELDPGYTQAYYVLGRYYSRIRERRRPNGPFGSFKN